MMYKLVIQFMAYSHIPKYVKETVHPLNETLTKYIILDQQT